jgi:hypothetical protein
LIWQNFIKMIVQFEADIGATKLVRLVSSLCFNARKFMIDTLEFAHPFIDSISDNVITQHKLIVGVAWKIF